MPFWPLFVLSVLGFSFYSGVQVLLADMMQLIVDYIGDNVHPGEGGVSAKIMWALGGDDFNLASARTWIVVALVLLGVGRGPRFFLSVTTSFPAFLTAWCTCCVWSCTKKCSLSQAATSTVTPPG